MDVTDWGSFPDKDCPAIELTPLQKLPYKKMIKCQDTVLHKLEFENRMLYAWQHAFNYADPHTTTDNAAKYANYYVTLASVDSYGQIAWPLHSETFIPALRIIEGDI